MAQAAPHVWIQVHHRLAMLFGWARVWAVGSPSTAHYLKGRHYSMIQCLPYSGVLLGGWIVAGHATRGLVVKGIGFEPYSPEESILGRPLTPRKFKLTVKADTRQFWMRHRVPVTDPLSVTQIIPY